MTEITPPSSVLEQYQLDPQGTNNFTKELGQEQFFELMMAQLKNQDPMEPMDNGEFLGQMAQFSTVTGIEGMQESLESLTQTYATSQTLQATQLVGQEVLIEDTGIELNEDESVNGAFELEAGSGDVKLDIIDAAGAVVQQVNLGPYSAGRHTFTWDGMSSEGKRMPPGKYEANISVQRDEGYEAATVLTSRVIDSVEFGAGGQTTLTTRQGTDITMADIRQIRNVDATNSTQ